ncbi:hypothetical protein CEXT_776381 [Caerostris extrusa]|uniref:Uncharacterized protein n=1 Tax=Caerostris extrusa TaxID=172846 RepID=A0AAV4NG36_CAEEX|nr:hypothetical protein CEXT_776381 [Caerostris extrusa]
MRYGRLSSSRTQNHSTRCLQRGFEVTHILASQSNVVQRVTHCIRIQEEVLRTSLLENVGHSRQTHTVIIIADTDTIRRPCKNCILR